MTQVSLRTSASGLIDLVGLGDMAKKSVWDDIVRSKVDSFSATVATRASQRGEALLSDVGHAVTGCDGSLSSPANGVGVGSRVGNSAQEVRRNDVAAARHVDCWVANRRGTRELIRMLRFW